MDIRALLEKDFSAVRDIVCQVHGLHVQNRPDVYRDSDPFGRDYFEFLRSDTGTFVLVAEDGDKIAGLCIVTLREPPKNPVMKPRRVAFMEDLCVDESYRRRGVGTELFREAAAQARQRGAETLELMVWSFNTSAIEFYRRMGLMPRSIIMEQKL